MANARPDTDRQPAATDLPARAQVEEALRASEERLRLATEVAGLFAWELDLPNNRFIWAENAAAVLGVPADMLPTDPNQSDFFTHPDDHERCVSTFLAALNSGAGRYSLEFRTINPVTKRLGWMQTHGIILRDPSGAPERIYGVTQDITGRRVVEERLGALQELTARFAAAQSLDEVRAIILDDLRFALGANIRVLRLLVDDMLVVEQFDGAYPVSPALHRQFSRMSLDAKHPAAEVARSGEPLFVPDQAEHHRRYPELVAATPGYPAQAGAYLPLRRGGALFGVLSLSFAEPHDWDAAERDFLLAVADRAATSYERARLFDAERRARERAERLQRLTEHLAASRTPDAVVQALLAEGLPALDTDAGLVAMPDGDELLLVGSDGYSETLMRPWQRISRSSPTPVAEAARLAQAIWVESPAVFAQRFGRLPAPEHLARSQAWVALPLLVGGQLLGVFGFSYPQPRSFDQDSRRYAETLADLCAQALERSRLLEAERQVGQRLRSLQTVTAALNGASTPAEVYRVVVNLGLFTGAGDERANSLQPNAGALYLCEDGGLRVVNEQGFDSAITTAYQKISLDAPVPIAEAVRRAAPIWMRSADDVVRQYPHLEAQTRELDSEAAASVPLLVDGSVLGVISLTFPQPLAFDEGEQSFLLALAAQAAQAIKRTQLIETERASRHSLEETAAVLGQALDAGRMLAWDTSGDRLILSANAAALLGPDGAAVHTAAEGLQYIHPDDREAKDASYRQALDNGGDYHAVYRFFNRERGEWLWLEDHGRVRVEQGRPVGISGVTQDITARMRVEEQLRYANERFRVAEEAAQGFNYEWNLDTGGVTRSESISRVLGYPREQLATSWRAWIELMHPDDRPQLDEAAAIAMAQNYPEQVFSNEYRVRHRDGHYIWVMERSLVVRDEYNRARRVIGQTVDISERKALEAEREQLLAQEQAARAAAEEASRLKDEFLATVSHELRTPLTAFLGYAELLQRRKRDEAYVGRTVAKMVQSARAQAQIIEDLLDVSRIVSGKLRLSPEPVDLRAVIQAALDTVRPSLDAKGIRLLLDLRPEARHVTGDPNRLQQVLWNLLANAAKFTPDGGTVTVRLETEGRQAVITVGDSGVGIPPEFLPFVFDRFRQADSTTNRAYGGLGLGLAIVRHLVELHGGTVAAVSPGVGQGATFTIRLPLAAGSEAQAPFAAQQPTPDAQPELEGLRLLVVDDQPVLLELLDEILTQAGAITQLCPGSRAALETLQSWRPDVLISDIAMPGEDGYWLIQQVRALPPEQGGAVPALALTAYVRLEDRLRVLAEGFQHYIAKPVVPEELVQSVAHLARTT